MVGMQTTAEAAGKRLPAVRRAHGPEQSRRTHGLEPLVVERDEGRTAWNLLTLSQTLSLVP